jgi:lysozyme family protein
LLIYFLKNYQESIMTTTLRELAAGKALSQKQVSADPDLVVEIQSGLVDHGYRLATDGIWGEQTMSAVSKFCKSRHLNNADTGLYGKSFALALLSTPQEHPVSRAGYQELWATMEINAKVLTQANKISALIIANCPRYLRVVLGSGGRIPWQFIGAIHSLESSLSFTTHLFNGDSLTARTVQYPQGQPTVGKPPFTWEESAIAAMKWQRLNLVTDWSIAGTLYQAEAYNGFGHRDYHPDTPTPYLWAGSNHYVKGKYVSDGHFDPNAVSGQIGVAVLLKLLNYG